MGLSAIYYAIMSLIFVNSQYLDVAKKKIDSRISDTISCHDCDYIPKVPNAGQIIEIGGKEIQIMHNGVQVIRGKYHGDWMSKIIEILHGHHEPQEEKAFYEVLKTMHAESVMIELGSFWSYYSMWFNKAIVNAKNYMIEPNAIKLQVGRDHFSLNNMSGSFYNYFIGKTSNAGATFIDWDAKEYAIPQICLDDFARAQNINFIDIIHSDIQGAEYDMLLGCIELIKNHKIGYFFISTHGNMHLPCLDFLRDHDFHIIAEHSVQESFSADGLIVARSNSYPGIDYVEISKR